MQRGHITLVIWTLKKSGLFGYFPKLYTHSKNKITAKETKLATKNVNNWFRKKRDFNDKLTSSKKKATSNKTRYLEFDIRLNDLPEKVKLILTKGLKKGLLSNYSILNSAKCFS